VFEQMQVETAPTPRSKDQAAGATSQNERISAFTNHNTTNNCPSVVCVLSIEVDGPGGTVCQAFLPLLRPAEGLEVF
jgi:hypothetical protein